MTNALSTAVHLWGEAKEGRAGRRRRRRRGPATSRRPCDVATRRDDRATGSDESTGRGRDRTATLGRGDEEEASGGHGGEEAREAVGSW